MHIDANTSVEALLERHPQLRDVLLELDVTLDADSVRMMLSELCQRYHLNLAQVVRRLRAERDDPMDLDPDEPFWV